MFGAIYAAYMHTSREAFQAVLLLSCTIGHVGTKCHAVIKYSRHIGCPEPTENGALLVSMPL